MGERKKNQPDDVSERPAGKSAGADTPPEQQEYPPGKARVQDEDEDLASQSDDDPALE